MKPKVYIETSIVSYLVARPSRDVVQAAAQRLTQAWWEDRSRFALFASDLVLREAAAGDAKAAARRLEVLAPVPLVRVSDEAADLADALLRAGGLPKRAGADALHIAVAAVHGLEYLLTRNCSTSPTRRSVVRSRPSAERRASTHRSSALRKNSSGSARMKIPIKDPILDEIHATREKFAREHGYDVRRMARALQEEERVLKRKVVSLPPRRTTPAKKAS